MVGTQFSFVSQPPQPADLGRYSTEGAVLSRHRNLQLNMSYDLWFWRQSKPLPLTLDQICEALAEEDDIDGIETLPIEQIKQALIDEFPNIDDQLSSMIWDGNDSYFQVSWPVSASHIAVSCGYKLLDNPDPLNRVIEAMGRFGCALYDPQTGERYEQPAIVPDDS